eukprot:CAMPEP_0174892870 /NCGR_PEP_ID=MMETSP0167-20121228/7771_1 /TAXON_ID=38298 /ORGANISM="Rhodella maculata, Strain CCMP736" /LENGTH=41 /DNA_ID= /DNA_START= /DNA_END= /DNA_ORIENTATION=
MCAARMPFQCGTQAPARPEERRERTCTESADTISPPISLAS